MTARFRRLLSQAALEQLGPARLTRLQGQAAYGDRTNPIRLSRLQIQSVYGDRTNPIYVSSMAVQGLFSLKEAPEDRITLPAVLDRELNPYRPTLPNEVEELSPILYEFMRESVGTTREQHNLTQAGDSTFPWELLTKIGPQKQFTLGSLGRFYHDDYGLILARYVQFQGMKESKWLTAPVGRLASSRVVDWKVTNDPGLSGPDLAMGILGSFTQPQNGWYGWVITQGANHANLRVLEGEALNQEQELVWYGDERLRGGGLGRVIGRVRGRVEEVNRFQWQLTPGTVFIDVEGPSVDSLRAMLGASFEEIESKLKAVQAAIDSIDVDNLLPTLDQLLAGLGQLQTNLTDDRRRNLADFSELRRRLNVLETSGSGLALYTRITEERNQIDRRQDASIQRLTELIQGAADYGPQIQSLTDLVSELQKKSGKSLVPLVTGEIPPRLVYLPDGQLVFVEIDL